MDPLIFCDITNPDTRFSLLIPDGQPFLQYIQYIRWWWKMRGYQMGTFMSQLPLCQPPQALDWTKPVNLAFVLAIT